MIIVFILLLLYSCTLLYPFIYLIINSFKNDYEVLVNPFKFTKTPSWDSYVYVFQEFKMGNMFVNSILLTTGETVVAMAMTVTAAYILSKYSFKGNHFIYAVALVSQMLPTIASLPSTYKLMSDTRLLGTYVGMILLESGAFGGAFLYLHAYFKQIPNDYMEAGYIDGCNDFQVYVRIMLPLAKNGIATFTIFRFLGFWNDYWFPYLFYSDHPTLAVGLADLSETAASSGAYTELFAAMVVAILPVLLFYAVFQKQLLGNTTQGGLKE